MNTSNSIDILLTAGLATFVVAGLVTAGMTSAIIAGAAIGGTYMLAK